jgi:hypothetical protein
MTIPLIKVGLKCPKRARDRHLARTSRPRQRNTALDAAAVGEGHPWRWNDRHASVGIPVLAWIFGDT